MINQVMKPIPLTKARDSFFQLLDRAQTGQTITPVNEQTGQLYDLSAIQHTIGG